MDPSSVHGMFQEIMLAVQQSNAEIAELRQECSELRLANVSLERQVRDSMQVWIYQAVLFSYPTSSAEPLVHSQWDAWIHDTISA